MVKNSMEGRSVRTKKSRDGCRDPGWRTRRRYAPGRFIWQLVGVLETYGSICLIGTKV